MIISFFEEFPTKKNLQKIDLVNWPSKLYLAAPSLKKFLELKSKIRNKKIKEIIYWPILAKKEGYWISPFSRRNSLERIFSELKNKKTPMMLDLELPLRHNPLLLFSQSVNFFKNKKIITQFINNYSGKIYSTEYHYNSNFSDIILKNLGLKYSNVQKIKMMYHSLHKFNERKIKEIIKGGLTPAFGTIAAGINNNEKILSNQELNRDLKLAKSLQCKEVIIFRLGGLNKKLTELIKEFS